MRPAEAVLVTGATGFVGRRIVEELLRTSDGDLWVFARSTPAQRAAARVADALGGATLPARVRVVEGDLSAPGLALDAGELRTLRETVTTVIHAAGDPTFFPARPAAFSTGHVDGPCRLLAELARGRLRVWMQVSTAYVSGTRTGRVFADEGDCGQGFHNPYERVKLDAEIALGGAGAARDIDVRIVRPSAVVGGAPCTTGAAPSALLFDFIRMLAALRRLAGDREVPLRIEAAPAARFNIVPVDYVAQATVALARLPAAAGVRCHLVAADGLRQAGVLDVLTSRLGVRGLRLVDATREPLAQPTPAERKLARAIAAYRGYLQHDVIFDDTTARQALRDADITPPVLDVSALHGLVNQALGAMPPRESACLPVVEVV